ncbi:FecR domain-containing protein [Marinoscillum furvescens]|uniref:FecR family protein n=1 Tax=Marinoscillum furvescens DSM 4134 TaxID=1122208 RepID=A0A3D9L0W3_MARFU|nr:FecR domain-containing protein [Marinoscillum furvescens]RED95265.1 FecR family protein [Marinoscillum furvescens DSM 4134]
MEELIHKYLSSELSEQEEKELRAWLEDDSVNRQVFENITSHWKLSDAQVAQSKSNIYEKITGTQAVITSSNKSWKYVWRVAAIVVFMFALGALYDQYGNQRSDIQDVADHVIIEKEAQYGQKLTFQLPDGSVVKLNAGSKLTFPRTFNDESRQVELVGEAFFDVTKNPERPFVITAPQLEVTVLGTSFNVSAYEQASSASVAVKTGKVAVKNRTGAGSVTLLPLDQVTVQDQHLDKNRIPNEDAVFGWMNQILMFDDESFATIASKIERWYDVKIEMQTSVDADKTFTGKYKNPSIKALMESLSYAYDFNYELKEKTVIIK